MDLFRLFTDETLVLTPNSRLSAVILKKFNLAQQAAGKMSWPSQDILPLASWLQRSWRDYTAQAMSQLPLLLTPEQEQILWEEILRASRHSEHLLQVSGAAELAKSAWGILQQWRVDLSNPGLRTTEDGNIFFEWATEFARVCHANNWVDTNRLPALIAAKITAGVVIPPSKILLAGFTEITPVHSHLFAVCEAAGSHITQYEPPAKNNTIRRISLSDQETELLTMARWAKYQFTQNPAATICCVVPSLENLRDRVIQVFSAVFSPDNTYSLNHTTLPFNISAGKNLAFYPVIHTALQLLNLSAADISIDTLSLLLRSPFLCGAETEMFARSELENVLRRKNTHVISLEELGSKSYAAACPAFLAHIKSFLAVDGKTERSTVTHWIAIFMQVLTAWGWPGERSLDSAEYQTAETWLKLLADFAHHELMVGAVTYSQALHYLTYLTNSRLYQPESPETTIQILGALEAAEIPFDHLWVMGLDDTSWPQFPNPNPFIPQRLQKTLNMPHATAERELNFTRQLTTQLARSADDVIFSHALQKEDVELRVSPLLTGIKEITLPELPVADFTLPALQIFVNRHLECLHDEMAPAVTSAETILGGSSIFKNQAACPFKAFAENRLQVRKIETTTPGLRASERGTILHKAMELLWLELENQSTLINMAEENLIALIQQQVSLALKHFVKPSRANQRYLALEAERLEKIIRLWLEQEKQRPPFKIKALEEKREAVIGNIPFTVRVDRVDELENGKSLIIDYKTGTTNPLQDWFGSRPNEPQLPLYTVLEPRSTTGLLFAQINPQEMQWKGISANDLAIRKIKTLAQEKNIQAESWDEQIAHWKITLDTLAENFFNGNAEVDPKNGEETCRHCHLQLLCRIHEEQDPDQDSGQHEFYL
jgi:ATP-dependent helicase/nuclease subunit B